MTKRLIDHILMLTDGAAYGVVLGTWVGWVEPLLSIVALVYMIVRLCHTKTVRRLLRRLRRKT